MKTKTTITEINENDLMSLLECASSGSSWLSFGYNPDDDTSDEFMPFENTLAHILLNGGKIQACDYYAEDEEDFNGSLEHNYDDENECMIYYIGLDDIKNGIAKAIDMGGDPAQCALELVNDEIDLDLYGAENLVQIILFGELIYG